MEKYLLQSLKNWKGNEALKVYFYNEHYTNLLEDNGNSKYTPLEDGGFEYYKRLFESQEISKQTIDMVANYFKTYQSKVDTTYIDTGSHDGFSIYCDGSCAVHSTKVGRWAFVVVHNDDVIDENFETYEDTTNSEMELRGLYNSLSYANEHLSEEDVVIYCDSSYVVNGFNDWMYGWEKKGWKKANNTPVKYPEIWQEIRKLSYNTNVTVKWVKGHADNKWNNYVDKLTRD